MTWIGRDVDFRLEMSHVFACDCCHTTPRPFIVSFLFFPIANNMSDSVIPTKKRKLHHDDSTLLELCTCSKPDWNAVAARAISHPHEALEQQGSSTPLAVACRKGAPAECIKHILQAAPSLVRTLFQSRGTPLHEAVVCDGIMTSDVLELLLQADQQLEDDNDNGQSMSACLMQDVDGCTPLHLLIKRRFPWHVHNEADDACWFHMLQLLVARAPEAVEIPDRGEYEEPPLVMALKANTYVGGDLDGIMFQRVERRIRETVACMLEHRPEAARKVLSGARGSYAALHSAVFHGRCSDTIRLLLDAEQQGRATSNAALLPNAQGELPLHFAAMRGEPPNSTALLARSAPEAVLTRDVLGLTPLHWFWIRFVSTSMALENDRGEATVEARRIASTPGDKYVDFSLLERGDFYANLNMIRNLDPPIGFLQMRHIPNELNSDGYASELANRSAQVLSNTRQRYNEEQEQRTVVWTRREAVTSLFWTKVVSLLKAAAEEMNLEGGEFRLVNAALSCHSCPPAVAQLVCSLFPEELSMVDASTGKLPLHYAASRSWHSWDWPRANAEAGQTEPTSTQMLRGESIAVLQTAIEASPPQAARVADHKGRLALHHAIDTFVKACSSSGRAYMVDAHRPHVESMLHVLQQLVKCYPESLERRDGKTKLYPFLQATAAATEFRIPVAQW